MLVLVLIQSFRVSGLKDLQLRTLLLVFFCDQPFPIECESGVGEDAPIKQLEQFEVQFRDVRYEGSERMGDGVAQVRQFGQNYAATSLTACC